MFVRMRVGMTYVNVDELPLGTETYDVTFTARQLHIVRCWLFPAARTPNRLVRPLGADLYEIASDAEVSAYIDDLDALEDMLGGVPG